jgi:ubiquinone/menaquinone biosynthesis C-methylase UbiE
MSPARHGKQETIERVWRWLFMASSSAHEHFSEIAGVYRDVRTTDLEPILHIARKLRGISSVRAADVGCGAGRYDLKLFQHLGHKIEHLYCVDLTHRMLEQVKEYLARYRIRHFEVVRSAAPHLPFPPGHLNCLFSFNSIHHFDVFGFLREVSRVLEQGGRLFVYTRLRSQNSRNIWGRYFPLFCEKETRLYEFEELEMKIGAIPTLKIEHVQFFTYQRVSTLRRLLELARHRHYSTFSKYSSSEFQACLLRFEKNVRKNFNDLKNVKWTDENILLTIRKD